MKVLVHGGVNLSELDGWWAEAYTPQVGWALGDGEERGDDPAWDAAEGEALYFARAHCDPRILCPRRTRCPWRLGGADAGKHGAAYAAFFDQPRGARYTEQHYLPAAASYHERASNEGKLGVDIVNWRHALDQKWSGIRFGAVKLETNGARHVFEIEVYLDNLDPRAVQLELCADGIEDTESVTARDGAHSSTTRRSERLCLPCGRFGRPPGLGLYGQSDTTLRRRCDPTRRRSHPAAAVIRSMDDNSDEYGGDHNYLTRFAAFSRSGKSEDRT